MTSCDPHDEHCITCGDVGITMRVIDVRDGLALCEADGAARDVEIALLDAVEPGDVLLVHADVGLVKVR
jgi:hydrogenase expression/formation protein HypC